MLHFAAAGLAPLDIILALLGGSGMLGGVIAFYKLRPDLNSAAVTQAQGAAETMAVLQAQLAADRDAWRDRAMAAEAKCREMLERLEKCEQAHARRHRDPGSGS